MEILDRSTYVGPSHYAHFPVIRLELDLGPLEAWPTRRLGDAFIASLLDALPGLKEHGCSYGEPGGFVRRMTEGEGTWLGHVLEHVAIELQNVAGVKVTFGKTRETSRPGVYDVVFEYEQDDVGIEAADVALDLLHCLLPRELRPPSLADTTFDLATRRDDFIRYAQRRALGPSTASIVHAAEKRDIPWLRLNSQSLIQLGYGCHQQRIQATITGRTPHIAVELASDKEETNNILARLGLPVPKQRLVQSAARAVSAAERIGYPVVTKPYNGNHGRGVSIALTTPDEVTAGFLRAQEISNSVIVESFITGLDHRMLVVNGELVAVSRREPGKVVGDGVHTIRELVGLVNADPRRGIGHEKVLTQIELDEQALGILSKLGYTTDTVPSDGEEVYLRLTANLSTGGTATDMTDVVHPDNVEMAVRAIQAIGLDIGGVDFLSPDITQSYKDVGGAVCEVNAAPGFRMHMAPSEGRPRDAAGKVIDMLFPSGTSSTIPIAAITGTNGKTTTARLLAHIHKLSGKHVGLTTTDGVYIDGQRTVEGDMTGPTSARLVLSDPAVEVAVLETARGGLLRAGMAMRHVDVGAVLNIQPDHLGQKGIETLEQLAEVKRTVVEVATETAVLNADDPLTLRMAAYTEAKYVCYVTMDPAHDLVRQHIRAGGRACAIEAGVNGQMITIYDRGAHIPLLWTHLIPATLEGRATFNVQNAMFAAAMAFSMGVKLEDIRHGLRTFDTTFFQAPGRLNVYDEHPFKVLFDYGHNAHAVAALCELVNRMGVKGRRICVLSAPGDRRDEDIAAIGAAAAAANFDYYICRRDDSLRGRANDEVPRLLVAALSDAGIPDDRVTMIVDEVQAIEAALRMGRSGDLLLVFADALARGWKQIVNFRPDESASVVPAPRAARAVPRAAVHEEGPADDIRPAKASAVPGSDGLQSSWSSANEDLVLVRNERGVILAREANDWTLEPSEFPSPTIVDSRRLMGPNLYGARLGAVLEIRCDDDRFSALVRAWSIHAFHLLGALGWDIGPLVVRPERGGATLFLPAPIDVLMTATEVNEHAWVGAESGTDPYSPAVTKLRATADEERRSRPHLAEVYAAAIARGITANFDDESLCLGSGVGSRVWALGDLPTPDEILWDELSDVPIALVTGSNGKTTTTRLIAAMWRAADRVAGWCCSDGVWVDDVQLQSGDYSGPGGAREVLRDSRVEVAVLEAARGGILRRGLAVNHASAAIITNISADHFGEYGVGTLADLADVKGAVAHALDARGRLVLNADDPQLTALAERLTAPLSWFSIARGHPLVDAHVAAGGDAAIVADGRAMLHFAHEWHDLGDVNTMPLTLRGAARHNIANVLGASLVGAAMGVPVHAIRAALATFGAAATDNPGRLQINRFDGLTVLTDYAHNPDGLAALCTTAKAIPATRRLLVLGQAGNRDDELLRALPRAAFDVIPFDHVIIKEMISMLRGRTAGEIPRILADELSRLGVPAEHIEIADSEIGAVRRALSWARDGDLLVCPVHVSKAQVFALMRRLNQDGWLPGDALPDDPIV